MDLRRPQDAQALHLPDAVRALASLRVGAHLVLHARRRPPTWIGAFNETFVGQYGPEPPSSFDVYIAALYWSVMTLTSIGYGEMTPVNGAERLLCSIYMMLSGVMWTWAIGSVAAIASTLDPNSVEHHNTLDALNYFMRERELPRRLRMTLREFFNNARRIHELNNDGHLLNKMSPLLQGVVAITANRKWLQHVWYFRDIESVENGSEFIVALAKQLVIRSFVAHERLPTGQLYILRSGCVVRMWRFLVVGTVFGEDMILENKSLVDYAQAVALSYVEAYTLRPDLGKCRATSRGGETRPWRRLAHHTAARASTLHGAQARQVGAAVRCAAPSSKWLRRGARLVQHRTAGDAAAQCPGEEAAERELPRLRPSRRFEGRRRRLSRGVFCESCGWIVSDAAVTDAGSRSALVHALVPRGSHASHPHRRARKPCGRPFT